MAVQILGILGIALFYVVILVIGLVAARMRSKRVQNEENATTDGEEVMLAGRNIGLFVGAFTMTATWVGGGYINGTAEAVNKSSLIWAQSPWGYALSLMFGGFMFAKIMRKRGYVTLLDPFQERYGKRIGGLMYLPAFLGELLWSAATLKSLGATISVVMDLELGVSVVVSACIALFYTFFGGLWSVAYTDVAQLICMFVGMWLTIPFAITNYAVEDISVTSSKWTGTWDNATTGQWLDYALLLMFGGIPWQVYFQRVLSSKSHKRAQQLSFAAAFGCIVMAIPSILIGAIGTSTNWELTGYADKLIKTGNNTYKMPKEYYQLTMPLVLQHLTPSGVSFIGLGAVSAAVMSSVDSSVLSASSMFAHNIYKMIFRQNASDREMVWVIRVSIMVVGAIATTIALTVDSIYGLSILCSDLIYVILFPQLICVLYFRYANGYGAVISFFVGFILRICGGEPLLELPALIRYPYYNENQNDPQNFPFRTFSMLITTFTLWASSILTHVLFQKGIIPRKYDKANVFKNDTIEPFSFGDMVEIHGVDYNVNQGKDGDDGSTSCIEVNGNELAQQLLLNHNGTDEKKQRIGAEEKESKFSLTSPTRETPAAPTETISSTPNEPPPPYSASSTTPGVLLLPE